MKQTQLSTKSTNQKENKENSYILEQCSEMVRIFLEELKKHITDWKKLCTESKEICGLSFNLSELLNEQVFPLYWASGRTTWYSKQYPSGCFTVSNSKTGFSISSKDFCFDSKLQVTWHQYDDDDFNEDLAYTWYCNYCKEWYKKFKKNLYKCFLKTLTDNYNYNEEFILKVTSTSTFTLELV